MKTTVKQNNETFGYVSPEVTALNIEVSAVLCASNACTLDFNEVEFEGFNAWE